MYYYAKEKIMGYILTYKKHEFYPLDPKTEDIDIEDIAHALSLLCRANGHFRHFYSVGIHSVNCAKEALARGYSERVALGCLLHDGSEAYLADITRPVKRHLHKYLEIEEVLQNKIFEKWIPCLTEDEKKLIFEIDDAILYYEFTNIFEEKIFDYVPVLKSQPTFDFVDFSIIEIEFLSIFYRLSESVNRG